MEYRFERVIKETTRMSSRPDVPLSGSGESCVTQTLSNFGTRVHWGKKFCEKLLYPLIHEALKIPQRNIGPDGPELICHFANDFLYHKCSDSLCVSVYLCVCLCV